MLRTFFESQTIWGGSEKYRPPAPLQTSPSHPVSFGPARQRVMGARPFLGRSSSSENLKRRMCDLCNEMRPINEHQNKSVREEQKEVLLTKGNITHLDPKAERIISHL